MNINEVIDKCDAMREEIDGTERYEGLSYTVMRCIEFAYLEGLKTASGLVLIDDLLSKETRATLQQIRQLRTHKTLLKTDNLKRTRNCLNHET